MQGMRVVRWALAALTFAVILFAADGVRAQEVDAGAKDLIRANGLFQRQMYAEAADVYAAFIAAYPDRTEVPAARFALAACRYHGGQAKEAIPLLEKVLADPKFPQRDEALGVLGHSYLKQGQYEKATACFEQLLAHVTEGPQAEAAAINRAQSLYLSGKHVQALEACETFLRFFKKSDYRPAAAYFQALAQNALEKQVDAEKTLVGLLEAFPNAPQSVDALLLLGQVLEAQNKTDEAIVRYREMVKKAPAGRQGEARYSLGSALYKQGKHVDAIVELSAVEKTSAYAAPARLQLGLAQLAAEKPADARTTLAEVQRSDPSRAALAGYWIAQCDIREQKFDAAKASLAKLAAMDKPPVPAEQIAYDIAICTMASGQNEPAAALFGDFARKYPQSRQFVDAMYRQAYCLHRAGKYDQSHAICQTISSQAKSALTVSAASLDAENLFLLQRWDDAAKAFAALDASAEASQKPRIAFRMGQCAYFARKYKEAIRVLTPLLQDKQAMAQEDMGQATLLLGDALLQEGEYAKAAEVLTAHVARDRPDKPEAQLKLALAQIRGKNPTGAEKTLCELTAGKTDSPWVQRGLLEHAQLMVSQSQNEKAAAAALEKLSAANPPEDLAAPGLYLSAWIKSQAGQHAAAADLWGKLVEKYPRNSQAPSALFQQAVATKSAGDAQTALGLLEAYIKGNPGGNDIKAARHHAALCHMKLNRPEQAAKLLAELSRDSGGDGVLYDLAWAHRTAKDNPAAILAYRKLIADHPTSAYATAATGELALLLEERGEHQQAVPLFEKALADKATAADTVPVLQYRLGACYIQLKQAKRAREVFEAFAARFPDHELAASALAQAGSAAIDADDLAGAAGIFARVIGKYPRSEQSVSYALLKLGEIQAQQGDFDASLKSYRQFIEKFGKDKFIYLAHFGVGWAMENNEDYKSAREAYKKVTAGHNGPTAARAQFQIGETYFKQRDFKAAIPELLAVVDVYSYPEWSVRALIEVGSAYEQLKEAEKARQYYTQVIQQYEKQPEAQLARQRLAALGTP